MSAHTPGPWQVSRDNDTTLTIVAPWSEAIRPGDADGWGDYRGIHLAAITHHAGDGAVPKDHAEANARLIAAAPGLLAALRIAVRQNSHDMVMTGEELRECEAAIAKATGAAS